MAVLVTMLVTLFGGYGFLVAGTLAVAHRLGRALSPVGEVQSAPGTRPGGYRSWTMSAGLLLLFRLVGKRSLSQATTFAFVLLLIVGEATQQALLGEDFSARWLSR